MSKIKFNLKNYSEYTTLILLKVHTSEKAPVTISTKEKIKPSKWDAKKQRSKGRTKQDKKLNEYLDFLQGTALDIYRNFKKEGKPITNTKLKTAILSALGEVNNNLFFDFIDKLYTQKTQKGLQVRSYLSTKKILLKYDDTLTFESITIEFYHDFINYLFEAGYSKNYIGVIIKNIKIFMKAAFEASPPLHKNLDYTKSAFKKPSAPTFSIPLTVLDIQKLYRAQLPEHLQVTRDYFILACETGVRFQNWQDINIYNIKEQENTHLLRINTDKSNTNICVFVSDTAMEILKRYGGQLPPKKANPVVNRDLKEIGELAGLDRKVKRIIERREKETEYIELYKCLKSHTARTSFVTIMKSRGIQDSDIIKMTGHASSKTLKPYDKENATQNAIKISKLMKKKPYIYKVN